MSSSSVLVERPCTMKPTAAKITGKFQLTVPPEVRDLYGLQEGDLLEWSFDEERQHLVVEPKRAALISPMLDQRVAEAKRRMVERKRRAS